MVLGCSIAYAIFPDYYFHVPIPHIYPKNPLYAWLKNAPTSYSKYKYLYIILFLSALHSTCLQFFLSSLMDSSL